MAGSKSINAAAAARQDKFRVKTDGFYGERFRPSQDKYPGKALIYTNFRCVHTLRMMFSCG